MTEREVFLQGLGKKWRKENVHAQSVLPDGEERQTSVFEAYLDLQGHQSDNRRAERQWRGEVGAEVEQRKPVCHAGGAHHAHHLTTRKHKHLDALNSNSQIKQCVHYPAFPYQVDADVDERAEVWEERDDWLSLQGQADPLNQAAGRLPFHLSPRKRMYTPIPTRTHAVTICAHTHIKASCQKFGQATLEL